MARVHRFTVTAAQARIGDSVLRRGQQITMPIGDERAAALKADPRFRHTISEGSAPKEAAPDPRKAGKIIAEDEAEARGVHQTLRARVGACVEDVAKMRPGARAALRRILGKSDLTRSLRDAFGDILEVRPIDPADAEAPAAEVPDPIEGLLQRIRDLAAGKPWAEARLPEVEENLRAGLARIEDLFGAEEEPASWGPADEDEDHPVGARGGDSDDEPSPEKDAVEDAVEVGLPDAGKVADQAEEEADVRSLHAELRALLADDKSTVSSILRAAAAAGLDLPDDVRRSRSLPRVREVVRGMLPGKAPETAADLLT